MILSLQSKTIFKVKIIHTWKLYISKKIIHTWKLFISKLISEK